MKRHLNSYNGGQPYLKRCREGVDQHRVNAFAEMTATARDYYADLNGHPVIEKLNDNVESVDCSPLESYRAPASQSTLADFGFRKTYERKIEDRKREQMKRATHERISGYKLSQTDHTTDTQAEQQSMSIYLLRPNHRPFTRYQIPRTNWLNSPFNSS